MDSVNYIMPVIIDWSNCFISRFISKMLTIYFISMLLMIGYFIKEKHNQYFCIFVISTLRATNNFQVALSPSVHSSRKWFTFSDLNFAQSMQNTFGCCVFVSVQWSAVCVRLFALTSEWVIGRDKFYAHWLAECNFCGSIDRLSRIAKCMRLSCNNSTQFRLCCLFAIFVWFVRSAQCSTHVNRHANVIGFFHSSKYFSKAFRMIGKTKS